MFLKGKEKDKAKERKSRGNRKYGQAKLKHSKKGMISCVCAGVIGLIFILIIYAAYAARGSAAGYIGGLGLSAMIFAWIGFMSGIKGLRERDKNYITCRIGIGFNIFFLLCFISLFFRGFM
ncbi:MAG: DUF6142 family protein [Lachnospiraceae bacterium]|nr:DUF6142 family protein [Lachnospiraceae bacterium]